MKVKGMKIINLIEDTKGCGCLYEHGLSFYIETEKHKILFDTGASGAFLENAETLGIDLTEVDMVIVSHGHYDHAGGVLEFAKINPRAQIYMQASAGGDYFHPDHRGNRYIGIDKEILQLPQLICLSGEHRIDEELFLFANITGIRFRAKGNLELKKKVGESYVPDRFDHEQCLVIEGEEGNILISGCAHNGILNILDRYHELYETAPVIVISGFHLTQKTPYTDEETAAIRKLAEELRETDTVYYSGHCTGKAAFDRMKEVMGEKLMEIHSGDTLVSE